MVRWNGVGGGKNVTKCRRRQSIGCAGNDDQMVRWNGRDGIAWWGVHTLLGGWGRAASGQIHKEAVTLPASGMAFPGGQDCIE